MIPTIADMVCSAIAIRFFFDGFIFFVNVFMLFSSVDYIFSFGVFRVVRKFFIFPLSEIRIL